MWVTDLELSKISRCIGLAESLEMEHLPTGVRDVGKEIKELLTQTRTSVLTSIYEEGYDEGTV